jgi:type III secretory pathway component EscU
LTKVFFLYKVISRFIQNVFWSMLLHVNKLLSIFSTTLTFDHHAPLNNCFHLFIYRGHFHLMMTILTIMHLTIIVYYCEVHDGQDCLHQMEVPPVINKVTCLNQNSTVPAFVFGIGQCLVYTG